MVPPLGQLALLRGLISQAQLDAAIAEQEKARNAGQRVRPLGEILVAMGLLTQTQLTPLLQDMNAVAAVSATPVSTEERSAFAPKPEPVAEKIEFAAPAPPRAADLDKPLPAAPDPKPAPPSRKASSPNLPASPPSQKASSPALPAKTASSPHIPVAGKPDAPDPEAKTRRKAPTPFGKYSIVREIGRGGKGVVHEALDTVLDRKVAIKTIHVDSSIDAKEVEAEGRRFLAEARISASLPKHPHIVSVYEAGEIEGKRYLSMELIQGQSMMRWRRMSGVTIAHQAALIRDIALALDQAHKAGVVHRDIKPQNILVDRENQPHLTDFGLAKVKGQKEDLANTVPGKVWGTPVYMSPEHAKGLASLDHRADVYSLGILLYEAIAGRPPFRSDKPSEILDKLVREPVPPVGKFVDPASMTPIQRELEPVCLKALAKTPAERHASAKELAADISRCLGEGAGAGGKKKKTLLLAGAAAAVLLLAVAL
ncbi:MAG: protein kinase, partial [Planctomycetes bacterium]|nr:protein kinase [Planctomycetota bacterium]